MVDVCLRSLVYAVSTFWNLEELVINVGETSDTDQNIRDLFEALINVILPPKLQTLCCKFERMIYNNKALDWVSLLMLLMAKNKNKSLKRLEISLVFSLSDDYSKRYMDSLQEMLDKNL